LLIFWLKRKNARPNPGFIAQLDRWEADLGLSAAIVLPPVPPITTTAATKATAPMSAADSDDRGSAMCAEALAVLPSEEAASASSAE